MRCDLEHWARMDDEWQLRWVRVPEGTHLSKSRETRGASRDLLRENGTNRNLGPTESVPADEQMRRGSRSYLPRALDDNGEPGLSRGQELVIGFIAEVVQAVDWDAVLQQVVAPAVKRQTERIRKRVRSAVKRSGAQAPSAAEVVHLDPAPAVAQAIVASDSLKSVPMSSTEFRERAISALAAEAYAEQQKQILSNARIIDGPLPKELAGAMRLVLAGKVGSLDDRQLEAVMEFLNGGGCEGALAFAGGEQDKGLPAVSEE